MSPSILVVGATGNTGRGAVLGLSKFLDSQRYRVLGLTRSVKGPAAQKLATLAPTVQLIEKDWTTIDAAWLREHEVERAYVAPHNLPHQFVDETDLYVAMLEAKVKYVVKLATTSQWMYPTTRISYARTHWAVEMLLSQPEFNSMMWTSLRPPVFFSSVLAPSTYWLSKCQEGGADEVLPLSPPEDVRMSMIDSEDVGTVAAKLLSLSSPAPHNQQRYTINGPEGVTGRRLVEMIKQCTGVTPTKVEYNVLVNRGFLESGGYGPKFKAVLDEVARINKAGGVDPMHMRLSPEIESLGIKFTTPLQAVQKFLKDLKQSH